MFSKNHIGRPSNLELRNRKIKKILVYGAPILIVVIGIALLSSGSLSNLMGNSVTTYYCEDSTYTLDGTKCTKIIKKKAHLLGDIENNGKINSADAKLVARYVNKNIEFNEFQIAAMDVNKDENIDAQDYQIIFNYASGQNMTENGSMYELGEELVCPSDYKLDGEYCIKTLTVDAKKKDEYIIEFDANGGFNTMESQTVKYAVEAPIKKNKYINNYKRFLYWNVYNKTQDKWLCYDDKNDKQYLSKEECEGINKGYVHIYDEAKISKLANPGETVVLYAQWSDEYIINYSPNGGIGKMLPQVAHYNKSEQLRANSFSKENNYFIGWKVHSSIDNKWYCYSSNDNKKRVWLEQADCDKNGYVILKNEEKLNLNTTSLSNITLSAQWLEFNLKDDLSKKKIINGYIFDEEDKKININAKTGNDSNNYYYKWITYRYDTQSYESNCSILNDNIDKSMNLTLGPRKGKFEIYYDSHCLNKVLDIYTDKYINYYYRDKGKVSVKLIPAEIIITNVDTGKKKSISKIDKISKVPNNTSISFNVDYKIYDTSKEYYYLWQTRDEKPGIGFGIKGKGSKKLNTNEPLVMNIDMNLKDKSEALYYELEVRGILSISTSSNFGFQDTYKAETPIYKFKKYVIDIDKNGGKLIRSENGDRSSKLEEENYKPNTIVANSGRGIIWKRYYYKAGYDVSGFKLKDSKDNYFCYTDNKKTKKDFTSVNNCKKYGYIILTSNEKLPEKYINDKVIIETQWTNKPVETNISKTKNTKYKKGEKITNTISFKVNSKEKYYYQIGEEHFSLGSSMADLTDKQIIKNFDIYSKDYQGVGSYWNRFTTFSDCQEVKDSTQVKYTLPIEQKINLMGVIIYRDHYCFHPIDSIKNVYQNPQIYRCTNC